MEFCGHGGLLGSSVGGVKLSRLLRCTRIRLPVSNACHTILPSRQGEAGLQGTDLPARGEKRRIYGQFIAK